MLEIVSKGSSTLVERTVDELQKDIERKVVDFAADLELKLVEIEGPLLTEIRNTIRKTIEEYLGSMAAEGTITIEEGEEILIRYALTLIGKEKIGGYGRIGYGDVANMLGINRKTLVEKRRKYNLP